MASQITRIAKTLGLKMMDARGNLPLTVRDGDILLASEGDPGNCAYARACKREHGVVAAYFFRTAAWLQYRDRMVRYVLPPSMQKEIVAFDRNKTMAPGQYCLARPSKSRRMFMVKQRS